MTSTDEVYNVVCFSCNHVWQPGSRTPLWWKAKHHAEKGYHDALHVSGQECGCQKIVVDPDAPYRVIGYNDECREFNLPFVSLVRAAQKYLELARSGMFVVFFVDKKAEGTGRLSRLQQRLTELEWARP